MNNKRIPIWEIWRVSSKTKLKGHFISHRKPDVFKVGLDPQKSYIGVAFRPLQRSPFSLFCPHTSWEPYLYFFLKVICSLLASIVPHQELDDIIIFCYWNFYFSKLVINAGLMTIQKYSIYQTQKLTMKIAWFIFVYVIEFLQMTQLNVYPTIRKCILVFVFLFLGLFLF